MMALNRFVSPIVKGENLVNQAPSPRSALLSALQGSTTRWTPPQTVAPQIATPQTPMANVPAVSGFFDSSGLNGVAVMDGLNAQISGRAYEPMRQQQLSMMNRAESNARAANAQQVNRMGFSGTPLGAMAGNAVEGELLRNRFDNHLNLEVARQGDIRQGINTAIGYAGEVNRFDTEKIARDQLERELAGENFTRMLEGNPYMLEYLKAYQSGDPNALTTLMGEPGFQKVMQKLYEQDGGQGNFTADWAARKMDSWRRTTDPREMTIQGFVDSGMNREEAERWTDRGRLESMGITLDEETGEYRRMSDEEQKQTAKDHAQAMRNGQMVFKDYIFEGGKDNATYRYLLENTPEGYGDQTLEGKRRGTLVSGGGIGRKDNPGSTKYGNLEDAYSSGAPVKADGVLYYVSKVERKDGRSIYGDSWTSGTTTYTLTDPLTGKTRTVKTDSKKVNL